MTVTTSRIVGPKTRSMLAYLAEDPSNPTLMVDAALAAYNEADTATIVELVDHYSQHSAPPASLVNILGLAHMREGRPTEARALFADLSQAEPQNAEIRVNLAWAESALGHGAVANDLLDEATLAAVPQAASLKVQALHQSGSLAEALAFGRDVEAQRSSDPTLMSALAVAAIDANELEAARSYASAAGSTHEGLSTLGSLSLAEGETEHAELLFNRALGVYPASARALLGKGLVLLTQGNAGEAADLLEKAADIFRTHLGSWVAAGWARFIAGDPVASRALFERALALDENFAESHGGLAVLDIVENDIVSARRRLKIALRLDRQCLSAALAQILLAQASGKDATADRLRDLALATELGPSGQTLGQAMARLVPRMRYAKEG